MNFQSKKNISKLHPSVRVEVSGIVDLCNSFLNKKSTLEVIETFVSFDEQKTQYQIGRTIPGQILTNLKAGKSVQNYGFGLRVDLFVNEISLNVLSQKNWSAVEISTWTEIVALFANLGWKCSGNWTNQIDFNYFEKIGCDDWRRLSKLKQSGGYVVF